MKSPRSVKMAPRLVLTLVLLVIFALTAFSAYFPATTTARSDDGAAAVAAAWRRANDIGAYQYATEIEQTTWPLPKLENVGLGSTTEHLYIEGQMDAVAQSMAMKVWSGGGNALTGDDSLEIRIADGKAVGRVGMSGWREVDDFSGLFAPDRDPLAYLAGAEDVRHVGTETRSGVTIDRYAFRLDGPSFAAYMRDRMEEELVRKGELPAGLRLDMVQAYVGLAGEGELWLDSEGLPLRQILHVSFPPDYRERTEVQITTDFSQFQAGPARAAAGYPGSGLISKVRGKLARPTPQDLVQAGANLGLLGMCLVMASVLIVQRNSKRVYAATVMVVAASLLVTPLLQSEQVYAFSQKQATARAESEREQEAARQERELRASLRADESFDPRRDPLAKRDIDQPVSLPSSLDDARPASNPARVSAAGTECDLENDTGTDSDGDNLTDMQEGCIGTDSDDKDTDNDGLDDDVEVFELGTNPTTPDGKDSDGDGIRDGTEVVGFEDGAGYRWYLNPLDGDTNRDGIPDGVELPVKKNGELDCTDTDDDSIPNCDVDTDGDGTPDAFDFDDDDDGVPDQIDLARELAAGTVDGGEIAGLDRGVFRFKLDDLTQDTPVYVDFQLRPVNPDHLWYTLNVLDWPSDDREGQVQRVHDTTFGTSGKEANGDMRLIPMLEIEIPYQQGHYGHLPVKPGAPALLPTTPITAWLDADEMVAFNVTVRKIDGAGTLAAYVPLSLVKDPAGDGPVAFGGRMFYRPSVDEAGPLQKARLVWVIQAKTDYCLPVPDDFQPDEPDSDRYEAWCAGKDNWVERETVIHTYYDDWYLTGFSVREDRGLKAGVIFENPNYALNHGYDPDTYYEAYLWGLAANLDQTFVAGRGEDTDGDGKPDVRDLTLEDIWTRFHTGNSASPEERWDIPKNALQVITYTFPHQSYISHIPMTHTQKILSDYFMDGGTPKIENPTMLFAREETVRTVSLDAGDAVVQHSATIEDGVLATNQVKVVLDPNEVPETVLAGLNWAPYRYAGAGVWESDSIDEYVAKLKARLRPRFETDPDLNPDGYSPDEIRGIKDGAEIVAGAFYLTLFAGLSNVVEMDGTPLPLAYASEDVDVSYTGAKIGGVIAKVIVLEITSQVAEAGRWASLGRTIMDAKWFTRLFGTGATDETLNLLVKTGEGPGGKTGLLGGIWKGQTRLGRAGAPLLVVGAVVAVGLVAYVAIALALDIPGTEYVLQGISLAVSVALVGLAIKGLYTAVSTAGWQAVKNLAGTVTRASAIAAVVGMVVTSVIAVGFFVYSMVSGSVMPGTLVFDQALANMVATVIVAAIILAIGMIPVIGPLIVAIIGLIDALIVTACMVVEATTGVEDEGWWTLVKDYACGGISGAMTKLVETFIYDQTPLVDLQAPDRMTPTNFQVDVSPLAQGMAVDSSLSIGADVITALYRNAPLEPDRWEREIDALVEDGDFEALQRLIDDFGIGVFYIWQFADPFINDATFRYALVTTDTETIDVGIKQMEDEWQPASSGTFDSKRYTTTQHVDNGGNVTFVEPGLNWEPELYLAESHAIQAQECTTIPPLVPPNILPIPLPVCWLRPTEDTLHVPLGDNFKFDVFPATLDGFYTLSSMGDRSYALAWDASFPVLADADGDGLRSQAKGGNDPDDRFADTDADGLSDFYEVRQGLNPQDPDTDGDGWGDYEEVRHDTNPARADSDSDGLLDWEEVEGWEYVYGFDGSNDALITRVTSDPNDPDTDSDGITDKLEQVYGFNPRVYSEPNILSIESQITTPTQSDRFVAPGQTLAYTATVENKLRDRYALGLLEVDFPVAVQSGGVEPQAYKLPPGMGTTLAGYVTVQPDIVQSQRISLTHRAGASMANLRHEAGGRVLWLRFNEIAGATRFVDNSLLGHDGTCSGGTCPTAGQTGYAGLAVDFDGADDYVTLGNPDRMNFEGPITLAAWIKPHADDGYRSILTHGYRSSEGKQVFFHINDGEYQVGYWDNGDTARASYPVPASDLDNWVHLAGTYDGTKWRLYRNGAQVAEQAADTGAIVVDQNWFVGARDHGPDRFFDGLIDDVEILPLALSPAEIASRVREPVFHAEFEETDYDCSTTDGECYINDSSSSQNSITCPELCLDLLGTTYCHDQPDPRCPALGQNSPLGSSIRFDQKTHLLAGPSDSLDLSQGAGNFTLAAWIRPEDYTEYIPPDNKDGDADWEGWYAVFGGNTYPTLYVDGTGKKLGVRLNTTAGACGFKTTSDVLSLSAWNHVLVTFDDSLLTLYVDGEPVDPSAYTRGECDGRTLRSATSFHIGRRNKNGYIYYDRVCVEDEGDGSQTTAELQLDFDGSTVWGPTDVQGQGTTCAYYDIHESRRVTDDEAYRTVLCELDDSPGSLCYTGSGTGYNDDEVNVDVSIDNTDIGEREDSWDSSEEGSKADGRGHLEWAIDNDFYKGRLDDLRIYRYAFSEDEALDLYRGAERVLEIRFDEAPGRDVFYDYSGAGFNGTCDYSAGTCPNGGLPGRAGQAARFDGVDDYVQTSFENDLPVDDFTMAVWFKTDSSTNQKILYSSSDDRPLVVRNNVLRTCVANQCADGTTAVNDGQWHFAALVGDGSGVKVYLDGSTTPEATLSSVSGSMSGRLRIGQDASGSNFDGLIDHLIVIRKGLSTGEIADLIAEVPIVNLHLDDPVGATTFSDAANPSASGSCLITPTLMSDCGCPAAGADGWMRRGVVFEGLRYDSDAAQCISVPSDSAPDSFTVGGWFRPTRRRGVAQTLLHKVDAFDLSIPQQTMKVQFNIAQTIQANAVTQDPPTSQDLLIPNQWNHVMATYDRGRLNIYVNGSSAFSETISWSPQSSSAPIQVGNNFAGMADEVVVYDRALSDRDVEGLYQYQVTWYDTSFSHDLTVDADDPNVRLDYAGSHIPLQPGLVMAVVATDTTSLVEQVEYRVGDDVWRAAERDGDVWAFAITPTIAGPLVVRTRATDSAGNRARSDRTLIVDDAGPTVDLDAVFTADVLDAQTGLRLTGTATDDSSGVERVVATLLDANGVAVAGPQLARSTSGGVLHLPLDEPGGSTLFDDVTSYDNDGTCSGGACPTAGQPGYAGLAVDFGGTEDYIDLGNPAHLNFEGQITLAAWIKPRASDGYRSILTHGQDVSEGKQVFFHVNGGKYEVGYWDNGNTARASYDIPPEDLDTWVHLAGTYDGTAWRLYRNGVLVDEQASSTGAILVSRSWFVGARDRSAGTDRFFDGLIDDVRIYNRALSGVEVGALFSTPTVPANGWLANYDLSFPLNGHYTLLLEAVDKAGNTTTSELVRRALMAQSPVLQLDGTAPLADLTDTGGTPFALAGVESERPTITGTVSEVPYPTGRALHLHFEEPAGATEFHDGSRYHTVGTCAGGACPTAGEGGQLGGAARFDGGDQVNLGRNRRLGGLTEGFSVMAWVNLDSTAGWQRIISADTVSSTDGFGFGVDGGGLRLDTYGVKSYDTTGVALSAGQWTHVAAVMERTDAADLAVTFYVDGLAQETVTHTVPGLADEDDDWLIGPGLAGLLDELVLYGRALTPAQIQAIARPGISGIAGGEIGLLHVQDRGTPGAPSFQPISLTQAGPGFVPWTHQLPAGLEGPYEIHLRSTDRLSHTRTQPNVWQGEIDTQAPRAQLTHYPPRFTGDWDIYRCWAEDYNLTGTDYACPVPNSQPEYQEADWYTALFSQTKLYRYRSPAMPIRAAGPSDTLTACDAFGACTTVTRTTEGVPLTWPLGVVILTPTTHSAFTTLDPIEVSGAAYASDTLDNLTVTANAATIYTQTGVATQALAWAVSPAWTPPGEGTYTLVATAEDMDSDVITSGAPISGTPGLSTVVYVDTTPPGIAITTDRVSGDNFDSNGYVRVTGLVTETTGIRRLQVRLEISAGSGQADAWQDVSVSGPYPMAGVPWSAILYSGSPIPPSGRTYTLTARVTDVASRTVEVSRVIGADATPPDAFGVTLAYTDNQSIRQRVAPGATIYDAQNLSPTLTVTWTASSDEGGLAPYRVEWVEHQPAASPVLQSGDVTAPRSDDFGAGEAQKLSVRVSARDLYGNQTVQTLGPVYVDYEETPVYVGTDASGRLATPPYRGWLEAPCNLLGTDERASERAGSSVSDPQNLYAAWNGDGLRITWTGANWGDPGGAPADEDLFIYLDTQAGGTVQAYDPYTATSSPVLLPSYRVQTTMQRMAADYLLWVQDSTDASLMRWNDVDDEWQTSADTWDYVFESNLSTPHTHLYVPFSALSIADPVSASLSLVAFATEGDGLAVWAAMPPDNPVNSAWALDNPPEPGGELILTHRYGWSALGSGVCPQSGRFAGAHVEVSLAAKPAGIVYSLLGNGKDLPESTAERMATLIGWDVLQQEPCLSHPETPTCTWTIDTASKVAFDGQVELAHAMNVDAPALGNLRQVTYTLRMLNDGSAQATDVVAHVDTWGHLSLPGGAIQTTPVNLAVGEEYVYTFTAEIDTGHDPTHDDGWGTLEVVVFDDTGVYTAPHSYEYPLDWLYLDHEIDQTGPEYVEIQSPPGLIKPGQNTLGGFVYDQSAVPTVTLEVKDPADAVTTLDCTDSTPEDGQWTCPVDVGAAEEGAQFEIRAMATDVYGQSSIWFPWKPFVVDSRPPSVTLSNATIAALSDGWIGSGETTFKGKAYDDRLVGGVEVCDPAGGAGSCQAGEIALDAKTLPIDTYEYDHDAGTPLAIGDCAAALSIPITVTDDLTVADVDLGLNLDHPRRKDLVAYLVAPSGISVTLIHAGTEAANYDVLLDDSAAVPTWKDAVKHDTSGPYYENQRRPHTLLNALKDQAAQGTWHLVLCDVNPGENDGTYNHSSLILTVDTLPISTTATWRYPLPTTSADGVEQSRTVYALDSVGNRSTEPLSLTYRLDTVPPVITVRSNLTSTKVFTISGTVSDGGEVGGMGILMLMPDGTFWGAPIQPDGATWAYEHHFTQGERYIIWIMADDKAGNRSTVGPFEPGQEVTWRIYLPLVMRDESAR